MMLHAFVLHTLRTNRLVIHIVVVMTPHLNLRAPSGDQVTSLPVPRQDGLWRTSDDHHSRTPCHQCVHARSLGQLLIPCHIPPRCLNRDNRDRKSVCPRPQESIRRRKRRFALYRTSGCCVCLPLQVVWVAFGSSTMALGILSGLLHAWYQVRKDSRIMVPDIKAGKQSVGPDSLGIPLPSVKFKTLFL